jgi:Cu/Ag efflux pump CusA
MLPLVVLGNIAGLEIVHPIAVVVLGGLVTATLFTLFIVPVLYLALGTRHEPELRLGPEAA